MANVRTLDRSFAGGEISPEMFGRVDLAKFQTGLAICRNFIVLPHGPAVNRPGTEFVREVKDSTKRTRLVPFSFNTEQTFALEFSPGAIRFHTMGATLESSPGVPYEVATPYAEADLFDIHYVQSADVLTLVHPGYPPKELRRLGALNWTLTDITFQPNVDPPTALAAVASGPGGGTPVAQIYAVTAGKLDGNLFDESIASGTATATIDLNIVGNIITLNWAAPGGGADRYNVYKSQNGVFGYIGQAVGTTFIDDNITPDTSRTPPSGVNPFVGAGNYPAAVSYYEQRRAFAATVNRPQTVWMTRSATESNLTQSLPTRDDDAIVFRIAAREVNAIRHLVPLATLVLLTANAEWRIQSTDSGPLTPSTVSARPQSYIGANSVQPAVVGNNILYARARGGRVNEFSYAYDAQGGYRYVSADLSLVAPHLFQGKQIVDMALAKAPYQVMWAVSSDGDLVALTYVPEQQVSGWHHHVTLGGTFESVCAVGEGDEDAIYVVVRRTINGQTVRYVERFQTRQLSDQAHAFFVDAGARYDGAPISGAVTGLAHLEGQTVSILADGAVLPQQVVSGGAITLDNPASVITVGLPITADLQTVPLSFETQALGQGRAKNVNKVWLRVVDTLGLRVGPSFDEKQLAELKVRTTEPYGMPPGLQTGELEQVLYPSWGQDGSVCIRQTAPLPVTLAAMSMEVAIGG
ncbi:hypothetical protein [Cupriavidus basilensis]|uniref:hypothetical protein n=1 Tax=Cupriavidus basilensis TaxID=68895 RepID=UPI000750F981|nr:hypothetical protein [Cupriavidus basilensis]